MNIIDIPCGPIGSSRWDTPEEREAYRARKIGERWQEAKKRGVSLFGFVDAEKERADRPFSLTRIVPDGKREVLRFVSDHAALTRLREAVTAHGDKPGASRYEIHEGDELMLEVWHEPELGWIDRGKWA